MILHNHITSAVVYIQWLGKTHPVAADAAGVAELQGGWGSGNLAVSPCGLSWQKQMKRTAIMM